MPRLLWSLKGEEIMSYQEIKAREKKTKKKQTQRYREKN